MGLKIQNVSKVVGGETHLRQIDLVLKRGLVT